MFGHIHEGHGIRDEHGTTFVNASACDMHYRLRQPALVVEVPARAPAPTAAGARP